MKSCKICGKTLVPIGSARKNGANHKDWDTREYHKMCWKRKEEEEILCSRKDKFSLDDFLINLENKIINNIST